MNPNPGVRGVRHGQWGTGHGGQKFGPALNGPTSNFSTPAMTDAPPPVQNLRCVSGASSCAWKATLSLPWTANAPTNAG